MGGGKGRVQNTHLPGFCSSLTPCTFCTCQSPQWKRSTWTTSPAPLWSVPSSTHTNTQTKLPLLLTHILAVYLFIISTLAEKGKHHSTHPKLVNHCPYSSFSYADFLPMSSTHKRAVENHTHTHKKKKTPDSSADSSNLNNPAYKKDSQ